MKPKNWIWHQKFDADEAVPVNPYFNISQPAKSGIFQSEFNGEGPFEKAKKERDKITFIGYSNLPIHE